jgi:hypothetical protein
MNLLAKKRLKKTRKLNYGSRPLMSAIIIVPWKNRGISLGPRDIPWTTTMYLDLWILDFPQPPINFIV